MPAVATARLTGTGCGASLLAVADYPCPCCGYLVFAEAPGSYDICAICFWEDDLSQLRFVDLAGGANHPSLIEAQKNFQALGCSERCLLPHVRRPSVTEAKDSEWRPALESDIEPRTTGFDYGETYPADPTSLYYWRSSFWRARDAPVKST